MQASAAPDPAPVAPPKPGSSAATGAPPVESAAELALASSLAEAIPGFELLDRGLDLSERAHVHFLGLDRAGGLVLVLVVAGDGEGTPLKALDVLLFLRQQSAALLRHGAHPRLSSEAAPRLVLLGERFTARTLERLEPLVALGLEAFELRHLSSQSRQSSYLQRVVGQAPAAPSAAPGNPQAQSPTAAGGASARQTPQPAPDPRELHPWWPLAGHTQPGYAQPGGTQPVGVLPGSANQSQGLSSYAQTGHGQLGAVNGGAGHAPAAHLGSQPLSRPQLAQLAEVGQRLLRLDERIEQHNQTGGASFLFSGHPLAHLESQDDGPLHATIPGAAPRVLKDANAIEQFLDEAVSEYLRRQEGAWARPALT